MFRFLFIYMLAIVAGNSATIDYYPVQASCTVNSYDNVASAVSSCTNIEIDGITVPAGKTLELNLQKGSTLTFKGTIKFEHKEWSGPLVKISGDGITVQGASGHVLDGQGKLYWDGLGGKGTTKPKFVRIQTTGGSKLENIYLLNCPIACVSVGSSDTTISGWNVDVSEGDEHGGHNTDGFDLSSCHNVVIEKTTVKNQDDCIAVNYGTNLKFDEMTCSGGHGLSLSVGMSKTDPSTNVASNIVFSNSKVMKSANGMHVKTHRDGTTGYIDNVTYENIELSDITNYGVSIQEDYENGGSTGNANGNVPITNLNLINVKGSMSGKNGMPVYILCGTNGCSNWQWSGVEITNGHKSSKCNFTPSGFKC